MRAVRVHEFGAPEVMQIEEIPDPVAGAGEVLISIHAAGVNPVDTYVRSGAYATLQVSAVCWEGSSFGQTHELDAHGTDGTLYASCDWECLQEVRGSKAGTSGPAAPLPIPDALWADVRRDRVHDTYRDVFRGGAMVGDFVTAVREQRPCEPDFADGLRIQELCDAAVRSAEAGGGLLDV